MKITKFGGLTTEELIQEALVKLTNEDDLSLELLSRLMDATDSIEQYKVDLNDEINYWADKWDVLRKDYATIEAELAEYKGVE